MTNSKTLSIALLGLAAASMGVKADGGDAMGDGCMSVLQVAEANGKTAFINVANNIIDTPEAAALVAAATAEEPLDEQLTIFIPSNGPLADATLNQDAATAINVLSTHVVGMPISGEDITSGAVTEAEALNGEMLEFTDDSDDSATVSVAGSGSYSTILEADMMSCAGPVHFISSVLEPMGMADAVAPATPPMDAMPPMDEAMPPVEPGTRDLPAGAAGPCENVVDALEQTPETVELATVAATLLPPPTITFLEDPANNLTVLAPPNDLISCLGDAIQAGELTEADAISVISLHVIPDYLLAADFAPLDGMSIETASVDGEELMVMAAGGMVSFAVGNTTATVIEADIDGCGAAQVIHRIDGVLLPEGFDVDLQALCAADLAAAPRGAPGPAPTDSAYGITGLLTVAAATAVAFLAV